MTNLINYSGTYNIIGNQLFHTDKPLKLLLTSRTKITDKKSVKFLLDKSVKGGKYISSLYYYPEPQFPNWTYIETYTFDFQGVNYVLKCDTENNKAEILTTP